MTPLPRGDFPNPRPLVATYNFGWNDLVAATAEIRFDKSERAPSTCRATDRPSAWFGRFGNSTFATALWPMPRRSAQSRCIRLIELRKQDRHDRRCLQARLASSGSAPIPNQKRLPKPKTFSFPGGVFDMHSALLYRPQPAAARRRRLSTGGLSGHQRLPRHHHGLRPRADHGRGRHLPRDQTRSSAQQDWQETRARAAQEIPARQHLGFR